MKKFISFFIFCMLNISFSHAKSEGARVENDNIIYSYKGGEIQINMEKEPNGEIIICVKPLTKKTSVKFESIKKDKKNKKIMNISMMVKEETDLCASWVNLQPVSIGIDPYPVEHSILQGKEVYNQDHITVLIN